MPFRFRGNCQRLDNDEFLPPGEVNKQDQFSILKRFTWWEILLIIIGSIIFLILVVLLIRYCAVKRRQKKTKEFGDQMDENMVAQNLKNMLRNARLPPQSEMTYGYYIYNLFTNVISDCGGKRALRSIFFRSEEHTSELQSRSDLVCR